MHSGGFSHGLRPGRSPHQALDALVVGLKQKKVNWVLDAAFRGFFDNMSHEWATKFIEHRVADPRILRLIRKWLKASVSKDGQWSETKQGTPQGAVISPLLANIYLHYLSTYGRMSGAGKWQRLIVSVRLVYGFGRRSLTTTNTMRSGNIGQLHTFRPRINRPWRNVLVRRSQRAKKKRESPTRVFNRWIPITRIPHPYPHARFHATNPSQEP